MAAEPVITPMPLARTVAVLAFLAAGIARGAEPPDYEREIRPILIEHCYQCHGPDAAHRQGELRLDFRDRATARLPSGRTAVVPGELAASELWRRITHADASERMPPPEGKPLSADKRERLKRWIESGAAWPEHWSLVPPRRPPLVSVPAGWRHWPRNPIDLLIGQRLRAEGLAPSPPADRLTLLRRATLDLTGIVPSPEDIERHAADASPDAYERTVDRLLAAPRFGERMAVDWLDAARYGDTHGYHSESARHVALAAMGHRGAQRQYAVRPVHRGAARG